MSKHIVSKPSRAALLAAADKTLPDIIVPGLDVVFCGINPGLYSSATGYHFARPGNRFWATLYRAGFTPYLFPPSEGRGLTALGYGLTNLVVRATTRADDLSIDELREGARRLKHKVRRYRPRVVAVLGVSAYRVAFARPKAVLGEQDEKLHAARLWVLPSPSGLNAHYQPEALARIYGELQRAIHGDGR